VTLTACVIADALISADKVKDVDALARMANARTTTSRFVRPVGIL
jgi:hypothetical protein